MANKSAKVVLFSLIISAVFVFSACNILTNNVLFNNIQDYVVQANVTPVPAIQLLISTMPVNDGEQSDCFLSAVQDIPEDVTFTIENNGTEVLILRVTDPVVIGGSDASLFTILTQPSSMEIAPGDESEFTIRFILDSPGNKSALISVYSNDSDHNPYDISVTNEAFPSIGVESSGTEIPDTTGTVDMSELSFGDSTNRVITITNSGNADLVLANPLSLGGADTGQFDFATQPASTIAAGSSSSFTLTMDPSEPGLFSAELSIETNDPNTSTYTFGLTGAAVLDQREQYMERVSHHSVIRKGDGTVWAAGRNNYGQLGMGDTVERHQFTLVDDLEDAVAATSSGHSMVLLDDGTVWCWGYNPQGALGDGSTSTRFSPVQVIQTDGSPLTDIIEIHGGDGFSAALDKYGRLWAWGNNGSGQLGDNSRTNRSRAETVDSLTGVTDFSLGRYCFFAIKADGTVWSWGNNYYGQLGYDTGTSDQLIPYQVAALTDSVEISNSFNSFGLALMDDGNVKSWGLNAYGTLGDGSSGNRFEPLSIPDLSNVKSVHGGNYNAFVIHNNGDVSAWGQNTEGQLGIGTTDTTPLPVVIPTLSNVKAIAVGSSNLAVKEDNTLWGWGTNYYGQIGDQSTEIRTAPVQIFNTLTAGVYAPAGDYIINVDKDGTGWSWGRAQYGVLANGNTTVNQTRPEPVAAVEDFIDISSSGLCSLAVKGDGTVWAWGFNSDGRLAVGNTQHQKTPAQVPGLSSVAEVNSAGVFFHVIEDDGTLWGWGDNTYGQLGDGTVTRRDSPNEISGFDSPEEFSTGYYHVLALKDGDVWSWGSNSNGQLGRGPADSDAHSTPIKIPTLDTVEISAVCGSGFFSLALDSSGNVWTWGQNHLGQLGDNSTVDNPVPTMISGLADIVSIGAGAGHSVAVDSSGTVWCWGWNNSGQLGDSTTVDKLVPTEVYTGTNSMLTNGKYVADFEGNYSAVVDEDDVIWHWGNGNNGEIGIGSTNTIWIPVNPKYVFLME